MSFIESVKSEIEEYKLYKSSKNSRFLTPPEDIKKRNIFKFMRLKKFGEKYGDVLYSHFKVMNDIESYEFLINLFGKKKLERALSDPKATTAQIADILLQVRDSQIFDQDQSNYVLRNIRYCSVFNRATGLELSEFKLGIRPETFRREALSNKTIIDILEENAITKDILKEIYNMYGEEIIAQYNSDMSLRNATVLVTEGKKRKNLAVGGLQDHVTQYSEEEFHGIFQKYFGNQELSKTEQYILMGLLAKESELIGAYSVKHLREHPEYIKSEIHIGIFEDMIVAGKTYTNEERRTIVKLSKTWSADDWQRYKNLELLKQRMSRLPKTEETLEAIHRIEEILLKPLEEILTQSEEIADFMASAFMDYEVENRKQIIESVYNPGQAKEIVITDLSQMGSAAMLHFFNPEKQIINFDTYVEKLEERRSEELGIPFKFSETEKKAMLVQYKAQKNHYITDYAMELDAVGQVGSFDERYVTNVSNQLSTMVATPKEILKGLTIKGRIAVGFSKKTLSPELIATTSDFNTYSNKGIDYVESVNPFEDFSASYEELISDERADNSEVVLFRNSFEASLKPSYVMYIAYKPLDNWREKENIEQIKKQMEQVGLDVPLVIFDSYSIRENEKTEEVEK